MRPFSYQRATDPDTAVRALGAAAAANDPLTQARAQPLAGGTTLIDLMKLDVMRPSAIVDINPLARSWSAIEPKGDGVRLGALAKMSDVAAHDEIQRSYPVIANSLKLAASAQLRNMATLGGNVMQRTRCSYFRDVSYDNCNKRNPGSGCAAMDGINRMHAVLGVSDQCIATYPGDFAQALMALDATVEITGKSGARSLPFAQLHKTPGTTPEIETTLQPGELISAFSISGRWPRSVYLKARDRQSYEFALSSAAVALDVQNGTIRDARVALGGVATVPWRAREAEALLKGQKFDGGLAQRVADAAFADARGRRHNSFKIALGKRVVARALQQAVTMEI
ncbi:FAD-binding molybdopterin dehydrogenase [Bradyrhizobium sp. WBOS7]|uniref:FAD-binding molybdopterin dehydrogenase n=1 Tax=Bradyrhizobium betae TaxID=244734 RepID=A0AAE9NDA9_9BRAD|nr:MULTISPECIES: xanthine dehydrogenase family protein subunit M [Bradyrhizobium]MDD1574849.1 FAD-binding molybdopterin dehydrogenase [Bradyrhizobium sp. WBOS1]UUO38735.1 FAD-binding molybdopterin dehydrogenase [Bradyrhizobium sp. WBOS01]MDD1531514.1 FAD-binding molybdopterin dehydrogenase [Bradyrhizobium sp. WBOS2]MDD1581009.1 FAD-binding molybdopterin dehydrogenase [Bradyrhizobium sp. WBOS7]MDD1604521.1 FAD-binding molybdopterin dehydrogenase [Bradyrhizobium sp. WBOS16]